MHNALMDDYDATLIAHTGVQAKAFHAQAQPLYLALLATFNDHVSTHHTPILIGVHAVICLLETMRQSQEPSRPAGGKRAKKKAS